AGLDPSGRDEILNEVRQVYENTGITIILVSHSMEDIARLVGRILVMDMGKIVMDNSPREIFKRAHELENIGLGVPQITKLMREFNSQKIPIKDDVLTVDEAKDEILNYIRRKEDA